MIQRSILFLALGLVFTACSPQARGVSVTKQAKAITSDYSLQALALRFKQGH